MLGLAFADDKRWSEVLDTAGKALELDRTSQFIVAQPAEHATLSAACLALGDVGAARRHAEEGLLIAGRHEAKANQWRAALALARALLES